MGLLGKVLGVTGVAVGGIAAAAGLLGNKKNKLAELELEFSEDKKEYEKTKAKLVEKIQRGDRGAEKKLRVLEENFEAKKREYEINVKKLQPKKSKAELEREKQEYEHKMKMEKMEAAHVMEMEKISVQSKINSNSRVTAESDSSLICRNCGAVNEIGSKFCSSCGKELLTKRFCSKCGTEIALGTKFCSMCGERVV